MLHIRQVEILTKMQTGMQLTQPHMHRTSTIHMPVRPGSTPQVTNSLHLQDLCRTKVATHHSNKIKTFMLLKTSLHHLLGHHKHNKPILILMLLDKTLTHHEVVGMKM